VATKTNEERLMPKPVALYDSTRPYKIEEGQSAIIFPITHYSDQVSLKKFILTTPVIDYDFETGDFETENTIYKPCKD
jgi:hypothetical protein